MVIQKVPEDRRKAEVPPVCRRGQEERWGAPGRSASPLLLGRSSRSWECEGREDGLEHRFMKGKTAPDQADSFYAGWLGACGQSSRSCWSWL